MTTSKLPLSGLTLLALSAMLLPTTLNAAPLSNEYGGAVGGDPSESGASPGSVANPNSGPSPIVGGDPSTPGAWPGVVAISWPGSLCTGTLIHQRLVLTAAHCIVGLDPAQVTVQVGDRVSAPLQSLSVEKLGVDPDYCGKTEEDCRDFGYLLLSEPVEAVAPVRVLETQAEYDELIDVGEWVTVVGYGLDEQKVLGTKREVETTVSERSITGLSFDAGGDGLDSCNADSGGPAMVLDANGDWALAGVLSYGSTPCGEGATYGVPHVAMCWISEDSGIDVSPATCRSCDCVDLAPADDAIGGGCTIRAPMAAGTELAVMGTVFLMLLGWRRSVELRG